MTNQSKRQCRAIRHRQPVAYLVHDVTHRFMVAADRFRRARLLRHTLSSAVYPSFMIAFSSSRALVRVSSYSTVALPPARCTLAEVTPAVSLSARVTARTQWSHVIPLTFSFVVVIVTPESGPKRHATPRLRRCRASTGS